jgi:putative flippase GtrA
VIRHFFSRQFLGFVAVGGTAALLHWLARIALSQWLPFSLAVAMAYAVGMLVAFLLNSVFVFHRSTRPRSLQARDFVVINLASFPIVWAAAIGFEHALRALGLLHYTEALAHAIAISLPMLATFLIYKFHAFKD